MDITITDVRRATSDEWDEVWRACDYATYFHSREWAEIWSAYTNRRLSSHPILILFTDGKRALLPLSVQEQFRGVVNKYLSSPAKTYGGWLSSHPLDVGHGCLLVDYLRKTKNICWRLNPYDRLAMQMCPTEAYQDETHAIDLLTGFDVIFKSWTKGHRSAVHKAQKAGVLVKPALSIEDWKEYYKIYEESLERWGNGATSRYGWEFFEGMIRQNSPYIRLWLALHKKATAAGALCLYAKSHVVYWHGAARKEYFPLRPVHLLVHEAVKDAWGQGYSWFDFNPSGGHGGVKSFKKSFGAQRLSCPVVELKSVRARLCGKMVDLLAG
jgi:CelD/BcsL family acetyltransferase involved in cellulose biosynthesis